MTDYRERFLVPRRQADFKIVRLDPEQMPNELNGFIASLYPYRDIAPIERMQTELGQLSENPTQYRATLAMQQRGINGVLWFKSPPLEETTHAYQFGEWRLVPNPASHFGIANQSATKMKLIENIPHALSPIERKNIQVLRFPVDQAHSNEYEQIVKAINNPNLVQFSVRQGRGGYLVVNTQA